MILQSNKAVCEKEKAYQLCEQSPLTGRSPAGAVQPHAQTVPYHLIVRRPLVHAMADGNYYGSRFTYAGTQMG